MESSLYVRPREKMQEKGVAALSNAELLQVIIGSGGSGLPVAKIARKVSRVLAEKQSAVSLEDLIIVPGLGKVKAGQILAGFELSSRMSHGNFDGAEPYSDIFDDVRNEMNQTLMYALYDGADRLVYDHSKVINRKNSVSAIRKLFAEALARSATSIRIAIGSKNQLLDPSLNELSLAREAQSTARLLSIPITSFKLVGPDGEYDLKEKNNG